MQNEKESDLVKILAYIQALHKKRRKKKKQPKKAAG